MGFGNIIKVYLMDNGDTNKRIKCSIENRNILVYKIPRESINECKKIDELKHTGIYLLFGYDDQKDKDAVYVGQAGVRKNDEGILTRIQEHTRKSSEDYWNEVIAITTTDNKYTSTDINYLEYRFYDLAFDSKRYYIKNEKEPSCGNPSDEDKDKLEEFISYAKTIIGMLGYKVFEPVEVVKNKDNKELEFKCTNRGAEAIGVRTKDGKFIVKKGSKISPNGFTSSCFEHVKKRRKQEENKINNNILMEDVLFETPSGAACFVMGAMANGLTAWSTNDNRCIKLKDIIDKNA